LTQKIEQINVDELIMLARTIFVLTGIVGLANGRTSMSCLILPALWLGDLLGQNKLACILSWACRRCMVRYDQLGDIILLEDGSTAATAPCPRETSFHRDSYAVQEAGGSDDYLLAINARPHVRPALLDLGAGEEGVGTAGVDRGVLAGLADDWVHVGPLGVVKMVQQCTTLFIVDQWPGAGDGVLAVRRFELRIADVESFSDGIVSRRGYPHGFLRDSASLLAAAERSDLLHLFVPGIGTDSLVIPELETRIEFLKMMDDLAYVCHVVSGLSCNTVTLEKMQKANHRCVNGDGSGVM
jgi:hypothetical protein